MSSWPPHTQVMSAKHKAWSLYEHKPWFAGCRTNTDGDEAHLELLCKKDYQDRFTYITEIEGVKLKVVRV